MLKILWSFILDFWRDGSVLLGAIAAPLSIAFTLAKAFDVQALGHLREVSYAWAFAPLTLWFFVAYVRRRAASMAAANLEDPLPNWTISELFHFIKPQGLLDNSSWLTVGGDILDKLSTGQIRAWGRLVTVSQNHRSPLTPIDSEYWAAARFTYTFLAPDSRYDLHAYDADILGVGRRFNDIQVNKASALRIWSRTK
jgi:hypothetical protein